MFMRNRAHMCAMCLGADEAHHKRHVDIAERLRAIYESCGEEWPIIPTAEPERGRPRTRESEDAEDEDEDERSSISGGAAAKRKERKEQKRLIRAASRPRVITQDEIKYIDSVLHPASAADGDAEGPSNPDEVDEIEKNLRYNAQVYNTGSRRVLKEFARIPDADVNFEGEMERIFEALRITELLKRNARNRGLQGRDLKNFEGLVAEFKERVVEDQVLVKKDELEVRMRRAAYLRYTNRASFDIVEERYTDKDWKTGAKIVQTESRTESSGSASPFECEVANERENVIASPLPATPAAPDLRHLWKGHKRIASDGELEDVVTVSHSPSRIPRKPTGVMKRQPAQLRLIINEKSSSKSIGSPVLSRRHPRLPVRSPDRSRPLLSHGMRHPSPGRNMYEHLISDNDGWDYEGKDPNLAVRSPIAEERPDTQPLPPAASVWAKRPKLLASETVKDRKVTPEPADTGHPPVSQKKAKKKEREVKRKAKRSAEKGPVAAGELEAEDGTLTFEVETAKGRVAIEPIRITQSSSTLELESHAEEEELLIQDNYAKVEVAKEAKASAAADTSRSPTASSPRIATTPHLTTSDSLPPFPVISYSRHADWKKYTRFLRVDALSSPAYTAQISCSGDASCIFEVTSTPDCPFHPPRCSCCDPFLDQCYLVYPCPEAYTCGPFNRIRAQKLLDMYETHPQTKGRLMLIDDDMASWFLIEPSQRRIDRKNAPPAGTPERLVTEYFDYYFQGYEKGPLMQQETQFEELWNRNVRLRQSLSSTELGQLALEFEAGTGPRMCYCYAVLPEDLDSKDIVECSYVGCPKKYFHRACVTGLGADKVTRWYCTICEPLIGDIAANLIEDLDMMALARNPSKGVEIARKCSDCGGPMGNGMD